MVRNLGVSIDITLTVNDCIYGNYANFYIEEKCGYYSTIGVCSNPTKTFTAPNYPTTLMLRVMEHIVSPSCDGEWSDYVEITVGADYQADPNACNDSSIMLIETMLDNPSNYSRRDFHSYDVDNTICGGGNSNCDVNSVWNFIKSNKEFQAPVKQDFESNINPLPFGLKTPRFGPSEFSGCEVVLLDASPDRMLANLLGPYSPILFPLPVPSLPMDIFDPVKIVVDENEKCITNYTLPGHMLYPGKVQRCIVEENCNGQTRVMVQTKGVGFHFFGDNALGEFFADRNKLVGKEAFQNVDERLINAFQNLSPATPPSPPSIPNPFDGNWVYSKHTTFLPATSSEHINYEENGVDNYLDLSKNSIQFLGGNSYIGTNYNGVPISGIWYVSGDTLVVDGAKNYFEFIGNDTLYTKVVYNVPDTLGNLIEMEFIATSIRQPVPCDTSLNLQGNIDSGIYRAENITSSGLVAMDSSIMYLAEQEIILNNSFEVELGSHFSALIVACDSISSQLQGNSEDFKMMEKPTSFWAKFLRLFLVGQYIRE